MKRRQFITLLGGAATWPLTARAQQPAKLPTIGFLGANNATFERASTDAFVQRLRELGWIENRTVAIEYRWAEGRDERFAEIAAEFTLRSARALPQPSQARRQPFFPVGGGQQVSFGVTAPLHAPNALPQGLPSRSQGRSLCSRR